MKLKLLPALLVVLGVAALIWRQMQVEPLKVSGFIEADEIRVGSRVGGRVHEVLVEEGQTVKLNTLLVRLEPFDLLQRLAEAQSTLAAAVAESDKLVSGYRAEETARALALRDEAEARYEEARRGPREQEIQEARDNLRLAEADVELAETVFKRKEELVGRKQIAQGEFDQAVAERKASRAREAVAQSRLDLIVEGTRQEQIKQAEARLAAAQSDLTLYQTGYRREDIARAKAQKDAAGAHVAVIEEQISELQIRAPCDGVIEAIELRPGDLVPASAPVLSVMDTRRMWLRAYVPQLHLALVPLEKRLPVRVDSAPDKTYWGRVTYVSRQAEFSPDNVQTPEERSKQVFRIKIEIEGDLSQLRPGMTADVLLEQATDE